MIKEIKMITLMKVENKTILHQRRITRTKIIRIHKKQKKKKKKRKMKELNKKGKKKI